VTRLRRQHQWLVELERRFDVLDDGLSAQQVKQSVVQYLKVLPEQAQDEVDIAVATHIEKTVRSLWWGLFTCYDVPGLPRTNNGLERFLRGLRTSQRRITGRKHVQNFLVRYGEFVTCVDYGETLPDLLQRLSAVSQADFLQERRRLDSSLLREAKRQSFRKKRIDYLQNLEEQWTKAMDYPTS
jgi:hypothetical protein